MKRSIAAFKLLGVSIRIDASWIFIALLFAWSLASGDFPQVYRGLSVPTYWAMAALAVAGLAASIVLHELAHTLVGRGLGVPIDGVTLFIFGGVAEMRAEPRSARAELLMAGAGPALSLALAGLFRLLALGPAGPVANVFDYLATLNLVLAVFNLLPAFPLDGGRVLRAILWLAMKDAARATRIAAGIGQVIGLGMMLLGLLGVLTGQLVGGLWWMVIGWYLRSLAAAERAQADARGAFLGVPVSRLMSPESDPPRADMTIDRFVDERLLRAQHDFYPLVREGRLAGAVTPGDLLKAERDAWSSTPLAAVGAGPETLGLVDAGEDAAAAFERMRRDGLGHLVVTDGERVAGVLSLKDLLELSRLRARLD